MRGEKGIIVEAHGLSKSDILIIDAGSGERGTGHFMGAYSMQLFYWESWGEEEERDIESSIDSRIVGAVVGIHVVVGLGALGSDNLLLW